MLGPFIVNLISSGGGLIMRAYNQSEKDVSHNDIPVDSVISSPHSPYLELLSFYYF